MARRRSGGAAPVVEPSSPRLSQPRGGQAPEQQHLMRRRMDANRPAALAALPIQPRPPADALPTRLEGADDRPGGQRRRLRFGTPDREEFDRRPLRMLPSIEASSSCSPKPRGGASSAMFMSEPLAGSPRNRVLPVLGSDTSSMPDREGSPDTTCQWSPRRNSASTAASTQDPGTSSLDFQDNNREDPTPQRSASKRRWQMARDAVRSQTLRRLAGDSAATPKTEAFSVAEFHSEASVDNRQPFAHSVPLGHADEAELEESARKKSQAELDIEMNELLRAATPPSGLPPAQPARGRGWQVLRRRALTNDGLQIFHGEGREDDLSVQTIKSERMDARMDRVLQWAIRLDRLEDDDNNKDDIDSCIDRVNRKVERLRKTCDDNNIKNYED